MYVASLKYWLVREIYTLLQVHVLTCMYKMLFCNASRVEFYRRYEDEDEDDCNVMIVVTSSVSISGLWSSK